VALAENSRGLAPVKGMKVLLSELLPRRPDEPGADRVLDTGEGHASRVTGLLRQTGEAWA
jgi:hypothetical protein